MMTGHLSKFFRKRAHRGGLSPGTLSLDADVREEPAHVTLTRYTETLHESFEIDAHFDWAEARGQGVAWINVDGLKDLALLQALGEAYNIHPLALEDILNVGQRPKFEEYDNFAFIVLNMLTADPQSGEARSEQVSMVLMDKLLITFQESRGDVFDPVRERARGGKGRIRKRGADYLAYCLVDAIVDNYFFLLEKISERVEDIESDLVSAPEAGHLHEIHRLKRELIFLRKSIWPLRELLGGMERSESPLIDGSTGVFLRDVYDHCIQIIDSVESLRDIVTGMLDIYLSSVNNKMSEVMKVLTMIATIFIPLSFIAGLYGMNFEYMPELKLHYGYFGVLLLMVGIAATMLLFFRRRKWL